MREAKTEEEVWDSGLLSTDVSTGITYEGKALKPCTAYVVQVEVTDNYGRKAVAETVFETGFLKKDKSVWEGADWIGAPDFHVAANARGVFVLESTFRMKEGSKRAGVVFGANDFRLLDHNQNEYGLEGENYIRYEINRAGETPVLDIYRVGYAKDDKKDVPFATVELDKNVNFDEFHCLKIVVDGYVATAEPVSSKAIAEKMPGRISSATIRNELADLVELGYLEQPHTSAGRVPSAKGYRLYVNELMERKALSAEETAKINDALSGQMKQVDQVISQAGQMVSSFVGYPTYAVADHRTAATVQRFELIAVDEGSFIAVVMLSDNRVKSQLMRLELPVDADTLPQLSHLLNTHFTGVGAEKMNATLMSLSEQVSGQWFLLLNRVTEYACTLLEEAQHQQVFTNGASQLLKFPEFRDIDKAHDLMSFMVDNKEDLPVPQSDAPMQILIGPENVNDALKESSVVIASYDIGDNMRGLVGVVGPTRMDYAAVAARLSYFAESLSRMFGKKQLPEDTQ